MNFKLLVLIFCSLFISLDLMAVKNKKNENKSFYDKYYKNLEKNIRDHLYKIYGKNPFSILALVDGNNVLDTTSVKTIQRVEVKDEEFDFHWGSEDESVNGYRGKRIEDIFENNFDLAFIVHDYELLGLSKATKDWKSLGFKSSVFMPRPMSSYHVDENPVFIEREKLKILLQNISDLRQKMYNNFFKLVVQPQIKKIQFQVRDPKRANLYTSYKGSINEKDLFKNFLAQLDIKEKTILSLLEMIKNRMIQLEDRMLENGKRFLMQHSQINQNILRLISKNMQRIKHTPIYFNYFLDLIDDIDKTLSQASSALGCLLVHNNFIYHQPNEEEVYSEKESDSEDDLMQKRRLLDAEYSGSDNDFESDDFIKSICRNATDDSDADTTIIYSDCEDYSIWEKKPDGFQSYFSSNSDDKKTLPDHEDERDIPDVTSNPVAQDPTDLQIYDELVAKCEKRPGKFKVNSSSICDTKTIASHKKHANIQDVSANPDVQEPADEEIDSDDEIYAELMANDSDDEDPCNIL